MKESVLSLRGKTFFFQIVLKYKAFFMTHPLNIILDEFGI